MLLPRARKTPSLELLPALCCSLWTLGPWATAQLAPGTVTDRHAVFSFASFPNGSTDFEGTAHLRSGGRHGTDHLYQAWWYWRMNNDAREYALHNGGGQPTPTSTYAGNAAVLTWPDVDSRGIAARLDVQVFAAGTGAACIHKLTFTNNTGGNITLQVFGYADFDQCGVFNNVGTALRPGMMSITDFTCSTVGNLYGPGARYEVGTFPSVRGKLLDGRADTLADTGLPYGGGDFSGALHWQDVPLGPGASFSASMLLSEDFAPCGCARTAAATTFGSAKPGTNGAPVWNTTAAPLLGLPASLHIARGLANSPPQIYLGTGATSIPFPPFEITMLVDITRPYISFFGASFDSTHQSVTTFPLPNVLALCGVTLHAQAFYVDPGSSRGIAHTSGLRWTLGGVF